MPTNLPPPEAERWTGPRERFGQGFMRGEYPVEGAFPIGRLAAIGRGFDAGVEETLARWRSLRDTSDYLTFDQFREIAGDYEIPYTSNMTYARAQRLVAERERAEYDSQYQDRPVMNFMGMMMPLMFDPVSVATLPFGGQSFAAARNATTMRQFLGHAALGGGKVGIASAPVEIAVQQSAYGEIRPDIFAGSVLGPVVASPVLLAPARAMRSIRNARSTQDAARYAEDPMADIEAGARALDADATAGAPPVRPVEDIPELPTARLGEMLDEYTGGPRGWLRDLAARAPQAIEQAQRMGIDPEAEPLAELIARQARFAATRSPREGRFTELQDFVDALDGRAAPEQMARLRERGVLAEVEQQRAAEAVSPFQRRAEELIPARRAEAARKELSELAVSPEFEQVARALRTHPAHRDHPERLAYQAFLKDGLDGAQARYLNRLDDEYERVVAREAELAKPRRGRRSKAHLAEQEALRAERARIVAERERVQGQMTRLDDQVPLEDIMAALDAARLQSPITEAPPPPSTRGAAILDDLADDPALEDVLRFARTHGEDVAEIEALAASVNDAMVRC